MARKAALVLFMLALVACGSDSGTEPDASSSASAEKYDAFVEYKGRRYEMVVPGACGEDPDGTYLTWAVTLDSDGAMIPDAPHMYAMREAGWSVIDFYDPTDDSVVRIYREGRERFKFQDGVLEFSGELGAGLNRTARVRIACPGASATQARQDAEARR